MKGEELLRHAIESDSNRVASEKGSLFSVRPWKRLLTYFAGPGANFLFSILVLSIVWFAGFTFQTYGNRIALLSDYPDITTQKSYPANEAGLRTGDVIKAINGKRVDNFQDLEQIIAPNPSKSIVLTIARGSNTVSLEVTPRLDTSTGAAVIGVSPWIDPVIGTVTNGSSAALAGLLPGDTITQAGGKEIRNTLDFLAVLGDNPSKLPIAYSRDGAVHETILNLSYSNKGVTTTGISFKMLTERSARTDLLGAIGRGASETANNLVLTVKGIGLLFKGVNLKQAVSGPIRITYYVGEITQAGFKFGLGEGFANLFRFLCILSVALFFMNLLPIPAMDGGLIVLSLVEMITGKATHPQFFYRFQVIGFVLIFGLIILTTFSDVSFLIGR